MSALQIPVRVSPSRANAVRSRTQRRHKRKALTTKAALSGTPWKNNGACRVDELAFENVLNWVEFHGGYVHQSLTMGYSMVTGSRGILARERIEEGEMKSGPLLAVPDSLRMNAAMSQKRLMPTINMCELPPLGKFSESIQTSLLLAFEKRKGAKQHLRTHREACVPGSDSFWAPYIETLPSTPSCAWILPENELRVEIVLLPSHIRDSEDCLERAKLHAMAYQQEIEEAIDDYGDALGLEFDDVKWALGHVHSRAYGEECSLIPIVDLLNHHAAAMPPLGAMSDDDIPMTYVGSFYYGTPRSLQPGDELFINYSFPKHLSPLAIFLDFGFLPQEFTKIPIVQAHRNGHLDRIGGKESGRSVKRPA